MCEQNVDEIDPLVKRAATIDSSKCHAIQSGISFVLKYQGIDRTVFFIKLSIGF
jgi:hypothetical protein